MWVFCGDKTGGGDKSKTQKRSAKKKKCKNFLWDNKHPNALQGILSLKVMYSIYTFYDIETICCRFLFIKQKN